MEKKGTAGRSTDENIIRLMCFACSMANIYKIFSAFPQPQRLCERAEILRYKYTVSLVTNFIFISPSRVFR
jgi:hypothetical protein